MLDYQIIKQFSTAEYILLSIILLLLAAFLFLFIYTLYLRGYYNYKNRHKQKMQIIWEDILLNELYGGNTAHLFNLDSQEYKTVFNLKFKEFQIFGEFIENYLVDLRGEDYTHIVTFLELIGYNDILMKALDSKDKWNRAYAARFLGLVRYKKAKAKLLKLVYDKSPVVYLNAFEALQHIGSERELPQILKDIFSNKNIGNSKVVEIILGFGNEIDPILISLLQDEDATDMSKKLIVDILSSRNILESSQTILALANNTGDLELKIACIKALGRLEDPDSESLLLENLKSDNWIIRSQSAKSLGKIGIKANIPVFLNILNYDKSYLAVFYSAQALKLLGNEGESVLYSVLKNPPNTQTEKIINHILFEEN